MMTEDALTRNRSAEIIMSNNGDCLDEIRDFIEMMERLYCPIPTNIIENYFLQEKCNYPNFGLVADILTWMIQRYDLNHSSLPSEKQMPRNAIRQTCIESESDRIQFVKQAVLLFHEKENIQLDPKAIYAADGTSLKELAKIAKVLMDAVNVEEEYRSEIKEKSRGMGKKEGEQQQQQEEDELMQQQQQQQAEEPEPAPIMTMSSFESLLDDMDRLTSLGKKLTDSAARLHDLLGQESTNQEEINKIVSTLYHDANSSSQEQVGRKRPTTTTLETTVEAFLKEKMASIKHDVCSLEEELTHLEADKHDAVFDLNRKNEELERNKIRLRNLQHTRPSYMDEYESLEKELQKQYDLYMERYRNIHYLHHELKSVEKEEQALQDKIQKRTMELQTRLREEEQQMSNEMMLPNPKHPRNNDIPRATNNDDSPLVSSSNTAQPKHTAVLEKDHKETTNHDNTHDSSSGSSALIISQCSTEEEQLSNSGKESMLESPFSRTTSISVDSSTFFMNGPDFKSFVSPTSKSSLSGDESDDHF